MSFRLLVFLSLSVLCAYAEYTIPFLMWGSKIPNYDEYRAPRFIEEKRFNAIINQEYKNNNIFVIFMVDKLSPEIMSSKQDSQPVFKKLSNYVQDMPYFFVPSNQSALNNLITKFKTEEFNTSTFDVKKIGFDNKIILIKLHNDNEVSRSLNDEFISNVYEDISKMNGNTVFVFTARKLAITQKNRVRRQANVDSNIDIVSQNLLMSVTGLSYKEGKETVKLNQKPTEITELINNTLSVTLTFGSDTVKMNFKYSSGYWLFASVNFTKAGGETKHLKPKSEVYALNGFSYMCSMNVTFEEEKTNSTEKLSITFENLKIKPFFTKVNESQLIYGDAFDCVGFFSAPIWSGLLVSFLMIIITFYSIMMMMDIKTMDRFDDPKGKTITINASE